eukprot:65757-Ditylum_brightwellii.AAC.1
MAFALVPIGGLMMYVDSVHNSGVPKLDASQNQFGAYVPPPEGLLVETRLPEHAAITTYVPYHWQNL